jgi:hypothetical protein
VGVWTLQDPGQELGLLESQRFLIKERRACGEAETTYDVFDQQTQNRVGIVREEPGSFRRYLPSFLNRLFRSTKLEARETVDEPLVFTVRRTVALWRQGMEVYDADDHLIGYSENRSLSGRGNYWVYDRRGIPFVEIKRSLQGRRYGFVGPNGRELGVLTSERTESAGGAGAADHDYLVSMSEELAEQPLAKMLLLGAALALAIGHRTQAP